MRRSGRNWEEGGGIDLEEANKRKKKKKRTRRCRKKKG